MPFTAFDTLALRAQIAGMSHKALRLYVLLSTYADREGICWPGIAELASKSGLRVESVMDAMQELESAGMMVYKRRNERDSVTGQMMPNVYEIRGCLIRADSGFDSSSKHEPIPPFELKSQTTNEITNSNNQLPSNQFHKPPPPTNNEPRREDGKAKASTMRNAEEQGEGQGQGQPRKNSAAGTAPQNSKATPPPLPPLPRGFDADAEMVDQDDEVAARWMVSEAMTRQNGGEYRATLSMANARRYIARFGRVRCRAAITMARRDPDTKKLIGRADYLLRTSVSEEAQALQNEIDWMNQDNANSGD
jgi:hypothetical protein